MLKGYLPLSFLSTSQRPYTECIEERLKNYLNHMEYILRVYLKGIPEERVNALMISRIYHVLDDNLANYVRKVQSPDHDTQYLISHQVYYEMKHLRHFSL